MVHAAGYYTADTIYGVSYYGTDKPEWKAGRAKVSPEDFLRLLKGVENGECIYAEFTEKDFPLLDIIEEEYGIH